MRKVISLLALLLVALSGCGVQPAAPALQVPPAGIDGALPPDPEGAAAPEPPPVPNAKPVTEANFADLVAQHRPNELGLIPILEYHDFKDVEERWARRWDNFRRDLETLYAGGYRAVNLLDFLAGAYHLPAGTSPVIFTFDDSLVSQLKLVREGDVWAADPQSAVGIMLQFRKEHPDFGAAGSFYVNFTPVPFRERENWEEKLRFLVANGFEVGQHAEYHEDLSRLSDEGVRRALASQVRRIRAVLPDYDGSTLALPFGLWPKNKALATAGEWDGVRYRHRAVLLVGAEPSFSPFDRRFDPMALPRVQAIESEFERWLPILDKARYISDGDPHTVVIPDHLQRHLSDAATRGKVVRVYPAGP